MIDTKQLSPGAVALAAGLSVLALLIYAMQLATLANLAGSDAAGNAYAQAYGAIEIIFLWVLLAILMLIAFLKGDIPKPMLLAPVVLVPASGLVALAALDLLSRPSQPPHLWPIVLPASIPPLIVAYCFWALLPAMRAKIPARVAAGVTWGAVFALCVAIIPFQQARERADDLVAAALQKYEDDYAKLPADAPLWDWLPFLETRNTTMQNDILVRIRKLDRRQSDAELMLDRGDFPLRHLRALDLTPTPALCDKARALLRKQVEPLALKPGEAKSYSAIRVQVSDAADAMEWLVGYECSCDAESLAWENMTKAYKDEDWSVHRLVEVRDPKQLGRVVRNYPARFSMLTPRAHLKAWLDYAEKKEFRAQALAGARKLDHRNADAIEMLTGKDEHGTWLALEYLPALDLDATPPLCEAALWVLHKEFARIYRPKADDPRSYDELLGRLGRGDQFGALVWLASHGCDTAAGLGEAEDLIRTYQDSPARAAMLAKLAGLHRKP